MYTSTASTIFQVVLRFGQRTCRSSYHDSLIYLKIATNGRIKINGFFSDCFLVGSFATAFSAVITFSRLAFSVFLSLTTTFLRVIVGSSVPSSLWGPSLALILVTLALLLLTFVSKKSDTRLSQVYYAGNKKSRYSCTIRAPDITGKNASSCNFKMYSKSKSFSHASIASSIR